MPVLRSAFPEIPEMSKAEVISWLIDRFQDAGCVYSWDVTSGPAYRERDLWEMILYNGAKKYGIEIPLKALLEEEDEDRLDYVLGYFIGFIREKYGLKVSKGKEDEWIKFLQDNPGISQRLGAKTWQEIEFRL